MLTQITEQEIITMEWHFTNYANMKAYISDPFVYVNKEPSFCVIIVNLNNA